MGPVLEWPDAVVGLSPFHHLATVPVEDVAWTPAVVMTGVGVALAAVGFAAFQRRDVVGA